MALQFVPSRRCVYLFGTFALVFQAWHIHMTNQVFNQIGQIGNLGIWLPHRSLPRPREAVEWDRFGVGRVRNLWMHTLLNLFHSPKGPSSNQNMGHSGSRYTIIINECWQDICINSSNRWMCLTWLTDVLMVHSCVKQIHNLALALYNQICSKCLPSELHLTFSSFVHCNLQFIFGSSGCWMVLKCGIVQVSVCPNRFLGQPCSHNDEANPRQPPSPISPDDDLQDPKEFIEFLISANIRLVRLEFLLELHEDGRALPRRQEAENMRTRNGDTALVELHEYKKLLVNDATGRWDQLRIDFHV